MARTIKSRPDADQEPTNARTYELTPVTGWRTRVRDYTPLIGQANQEQLDQVRDVVYGLALRGADEKDITEFFGWDKTAVRSQLRPVIEMAQAELRLMLKAHQVETALGSKLPIAQIWAGKQFANQTDDATLRLQEDGEGGFSGLLITKVQANRDQTTGKTVAEPTQTVVQSSE